MHSDAILLSDPLIEFANGLVSRAQQAVDREWVRLGKPRPSEIPAHPKLKPYQVVCIKMEPCEIAKEFIDEGKSFM